MLFPVARGGKKGNGGASRLEPRVLEVLGIYLKNSLRGLSALPFTGPFIESSSGRTTDPWYRMSEAGLKTAVYA